MRNNKGGIILRAAVGLAGVHLVEEHRQAAGAAVAAERSAEVTARGGRHANGLGRNSTTMISLS
jgi:hypothetical protein